MTLAQRVTALAQALGADIKALSAAVSGLATPQAGDLAYSVDPARFSLPDWLPCDGALVPDASTPLSLQPHLVRAYNVDYAADGGIGSTAAAPQGVADMSGDFALFRMATTPYLIPMQRNAVGYSYVREGLFSNPNAAIVAAAIGKAGTVPNALGFSSAAGAAFYARRVSSTWSVNNVASIFSGKAFVGVVFGADNRFYLLSTTAPYLFSIAGDVSSSTLQEESGVSAGPVGLAISPNKKYMVSWHSAAPFLTIFEFDGTRYRQIGSPPMGAASFTRAEVSDTGVVVAKPSSGSIYYLCSVTPTGAISGMVQSTVDAATAWGVTDDGRSLLTWVSNAAKSYPIANDVVGTGTALAAYNFAAHGTLAGRFGLYQGRFLASSNVAASGYGLAMTATPAGWLAPRIRYGFMKA